MLGSACAEGVVHGLVCEHTVASVIPEEAKSEDSVKPSELLWRGSDFKNHLRVALRFAN